MGYHSMQKHYEFFKNNLASLKFLNTPPRKTIYNDAQKGSHEVCFDSLCYTKWYM